MKRIRWLILLILCSSGCTERIVVNIDPPEYKLVFYPVITNNKNIILNLSPSESILSDSVPPLKNAHVIIKDNNIPVDTVLIDNLGKGSSKIIPVNEHIYSFLAQADGFPNASCSVKLPLPVQSFVVDTSYISDPFSGKFINARIRLLDNAVSTDYYKVTINIRDYYYAHRYRDGVEYDTLIIGKIEREVLANNSIIDYFKTTYYNTYVIAEDQITFEDVKHFRYKLGSEIYYDGREFYFSDALFNGKELTISLLTYELGYLTVPAKYEIEVTTISEDLYKGLKSFARYGSKEDANLPFSEEVSIYSAVEGGYGFPVAYTTKVDTSYSVPGLK
jgi:hypothetical protein